MCRTMRVLPYWHSRHNRLLTRAPATLQRKYVVAPNSRAESDATAGPFIVNRTKYNPARLMSALSIIELNVVKDRRRRFITGLKDL